jgi:hypothetical protein
MAGRGPAPKGNAARRNLKVVALKVLQADPASQPELPAFNIKINVKGETFVREFEWPDQTQEWWAMWRDSPLSADFVANDWSELLDTALLHAAYWNGDLSVAGELRLRVGKFGATPEDRARLRIQFAKADQAETVKPPPGKAARSRRGPLTSAG